jgi:hypothetical protein
MILQRGARNVCQVESKTYHLYIGEEVRGFERSEVKAVLVAIRRSNRSVISNPSNSSLEKEREAG